MKILRQQGYSLLELAVVIVVAGVLLTAGAGLYVQRAEQARDVSHQALVAVADDAIAGFLFARARMPCPATGDNGIENCQAVIGQLPYRSLGLAEPLLNTAGQALTYAVYNQPSVTNTQDAALTLLKDRLQPFFADATPAVASAQELGYQNGLDFCQALVIAASKPPSSAHLNVGQSDDNYINVAYVLINPGARDSDGDGQLLDGVNSAMSDDSPRAAYPDQPADANYDDQVHAVYFSQLNQKLGCVNAMTPGAAHANALSAAAVMQQAMIEYREQLELIAFLAGADIAAATADTLKSVVDTAVTVAESATSVASAINSGGGLSGALVAAGLATGLAVVSLTATTAGLAFAIATAAISDQNVNNFQAQEQALSAIRIQIDSNLRAADQAGLYE
ncbi:type II secretion system protein [Pseudohongiella sp. SYSU M77423]|uniref:type II secretion system protein n=1 Tax=Pseudohongiella sp. SYSU M77423 TaxID=3042312 RepID=UPI0024800AB8|nr:type II secretion system protein [Pseudohongiella sp. SYSU M77423]MDH7942547.1 type II secretion system protein [Pseudohongiella sp. SYSU M77423]